jgi:hypothetical protein
MKTTAFLRWLSHFFQARHDGPPIGLSEPLRIACADPGAVPPVDELARLAVVGHHVVLQFPPSFREGKSQVIDQLTPLLLDHRVFDSGPGPGGTECVTVHKVIDERVVLANLALFLRAVRDFADTANDLCRRLARAHGIEPADLLARRADIERRWGNRLGDWTFCFHGLECGFTSRAGQVVDVRICFGDEFGVLDPYFLARFLRTTPLHREAARLLSDDFHDACRVMEVLKARGFLRVVEVTCEELGGLVSRGLVLGPPPGAQPGA